MFAGILYRFIYTVKRHKVDVWLPKRRLLHPLKGNEGTQTPLSDGLRYKLPFLHSNVMTKLMNRKSYRQFFRQIVVGLTCVIMIMPTPLLVGQSLHVVPDGRTQTTVTSNVAGTQTTVHTNTIRGTTGYNSFERFNVPGGNTTNLYVPDGAKSLVNLVHKERSQIDGVLNSYKNGQIGGNVFFLNPHGIIIGQSGVVNVGSLHLQTPTHDYMNQLLNEHGQISAVHEQMLFDGKVPISPSGLISVQGKINAVEGINLSAGEIDLARGSRVRAGYQVQVEFGSLVNVEGVNSGNELIQTPDGKIRIVAAGNVTAAGQVSADAVSSKNAGQIEILAGNDIKVNAGAEISARGIGQNSDGGEVVIFADRNSYLQDGAIVDVSAISGKGGFLEFSAKDTVNIQSNGLRSSAGGTILIDPTTVVWEGHSDSYGNEISTTISSNGANLTVTGTDITLRNAIITSQNSDKTTAGNIDITAQNLTMIASSILANGTTKSGDVKITLTGGEEWSLDLGPFDINVPFSPLKAEFSMDKDSFIKGKNVTIEVKTERGAVLDFDKMSADSGNMLADSFASIFNKIVGGLLDKANEKIESQLDNILAELGGKIRVDIATTKIQIDGTIDASEDVVIKATADVKAEVKHSGKGIGWSFAYVQADSEVEIGGTADIRAGKDITLISTAKTTIEAAPAEESKEGKDDKKETKKEENSSLPFDAAVTLGIAQSKNKVNVKQGANISASGDISVEALTERSHSVSVSGGSAESSVGFVVGVLIGDADTDVTIGGKLTSENISVKAVTNVLANLVTAEMTAASDNKGGDEEKGNGGGNDGGKDSSNPLLGIVDAIKEKLFDLIKKQFATDLEEVADNNENPTDKKDTPKDNKDTTNNESFPKFAFGLGLGVMVDNIDTTVTVAGDAVINAKKNFNVEAHTTNTPIVIATTSIGGYKEKNGSQAQKDTAVTTSLPVTVISQNSEAIIKDGAKIYVGENVKVSAKTEMPYNDDHYFVKLYEKLAKKDNEEKKDGKEEDEFDIVKGLNEMLQEDSLGLKSGLFNSWSQTTIDADGLAVGMMLSVGVINNNSLAKIGDNVTIGGISGTTPNVSVEAITDVQLGHVVGNIRSFLDEVPEFEKIGDVPEATKKAIENKDKLFKAMWGTTAKKGVGAGVLFNLVDNTAIAEVGNAVLEVDDLTVSAVTKGFDLGFAIGASKTDEFGMNGNVGVTVFQSDARAKVAEGAKITASGDVNIGAKDQTILINIGGSVVASHGTAFGLAVNVPIAIREVYAVWGDYPDDEDDSNAASVIESVVGGDVNIKAGALGVTATVAVAGAITTEAAPDPGKKMKSPEDSLNNVFKAFEGAKSLSGSASLREKVKEIQASMTKPGGDSSGSSSGGSSSIGIAGAVAVNLLIEDVVAGINGKVKISANSFEIEATNKAVEAALVGGIVVQTGSGTNNGIAGAVGVNMLFGDTKAFVDTKNSTLTYTDTFSAEANRGGYIGSLSAGAAGSASSKGFEVAGSLSIASIKSETLVDVTNTTIKKVGASATGDMILGAYNEALIVNIAGGLAIGGNVGVGISLAASNFTLDTRVNVLNSTLEARGLLATATTESLMVTLALAGGIAPSGNVGVGGTLALALSDGDTSVSIKNSNVTLSGDFIAYALSDTFNGTDNTYNNLVGLLADSEQKNNESDEESNYFNDKGEKVSFDKSEATYDADGKAVRNDTTEEKKITLGLSSRSPRIITAALSVGYGDTVGVGANLGVNLMTEETFVSLEGSTITTKGADIQAKTEGGMIAVSIGVGASSTVGVAGNIGVNLVGGRTEVVFNNSALTATSGNIKVLAESTAGIINASLGVGASTGTAGVAAGFSYNIVAHSVAVDLLQSTVSASGGSIDLAALNNSDLISILLSVGAGNTAGVGVALAINTIGTIQLDDADLETSNDTQAEKKKRENDLKIIANTVTNVGDDNNPLEVIWNARNRTEITIVESVVTSGGDISMDAASNGGMISISVAVGAAGTAGVGVGAAYNSISGSVRIFGNNSNITAQRNVIGSSQINNAMYSVVVGGGVGGTAGVAVSADANVLMASNEIAFLSNKADKGKIVATTGDIVFKATNSGEVLGSSLALAGGQYAGVAAALTVNVLKGLTNVRLTNATLTAGDSIVLDAETTNDLYSITGALALTISGTGSASVGATVAVNDLRSAANINVVDSTLTAGGNALIHTNVDADLLAVTGNVAVAVALFGVSVAGSVTYNGLRSTSEISISGTSIDAKANKASDFDGLASFYSIAGLSSTFKDKKGIGIAAYTHSEIENYFFLLAAATMAGVNVGVPVNDMNATTKISLDNSNLNQATGGTAAANVQDIIIEAMTETESMGVVAGLAGGIAAISAIVDMHMLRSQIETNIKNSNLKAARNISIG